MFEVPPPLYIYYSRFPTHLFVFVESRFSVARRRGLCVSVCFVCETTGNGTTAPPFVDALWACGSGIGPCACALARAREPVVCRGACCCSQAAVLLCCAVVWCCSSVCDGGEGEGTSSLGRKPALLPPSSFLVPPSSLLLIPIHMCGFPLQPILTPIIYIYYTIVSSNVHTCIYNLSTIYNICIYIAYRILPTRAHRARLHNTICIFSSLSLGTSHARITNNIICPNTPSYYGTSPPCTVHTSSQHSFRVKPRLVAIHHTILVMAISSKRQLRA